MYSIKKISNKAPRKCEFGTNVTKLWLSLTLYTVAAVIISGPRRAPAPLASAVGIQV